MRDEGSRVKKNRAEGSSGMTQMSSIGGSQSHHNGKARGSRKAGLKHKVTEFRQGYGSSSGQTSGYNSSGSGSGSSLVPCTQCGRIHSRTCLMSSGGCFRSGQQGHFARECPMFSKHLMGSQGSVVNIPQ
ncbi:glycine-rich protein 2-like [Hevea brasiliensis]|uniref:glycine-rich protein 2-like n=1 Tax=Hevea brasiliensis TaxID=3981 RepID=UPI0025CBC1C1|nr:glycine-rich protein 2-like [Hevea brasiliensis]